LPGGKELASLIYIKPLFLSFSYIGLFFLYKLSPKFLVTNITPNIMTVMQKVRLGFKNKVKTNLKFGLNQINQIEYRF